MSQAIPRDQIEETGARAAFLDLRDAAGMPAGGEICLKEEVKDVADAMGLDYPLYWSRRRLIFEIWIEYQRRSRSEQSFDFFYGNDGKDEYDYWLQDHVARDWGYITSSEARDLAEHIREYQKFEWGEP